MTWEPGYREWAPPKAVSGALACVWVQVVPPEGAEPTLVLPDACADLIWQRDQGAFVAGPDTGPVPTPLPPGSILVGARLRPGAGGPALGLPLIEILDQRVDLRDLRSEPARQLPGSLGPSEALRRIISVAADLVASRPPDALVSHAARLLARPETRVERLPRELGLGERQLRRRFQAVQGYGPKTLQRVLRFQRFLTMLDAAREEVDLAGIALDAGYADQAHLTRECTRLAGMPPAALHRARSV
jgi:AraC-like DNA-binding protein